MNIRNNVSMLAILAVASGITSSPSPAEEEGDGGASIHRPMLSPTGDRIAFMSDRTGEWELFVMDIDGQNVKRLTSHEGWDGYATWSPDGNKLIFDRGGDDIGEFKIPHIVDLETGEVRLFRRYDTWVSANQWSADARLIGFREQERTGARDLVWIDAKSGAITAITETEDISEGDSDLSPDGRILYFAATLNDATAIEKIDLETGARENVIDGQGRVYGLSVSPNGQRIAYTDTPAGEENAEIYIYDIETRQSRRLTHNDSWDHMPVWTADGQLIFTSYRSGHEEPYLLNPDSGATYRLSFP